MRHKFKGDEYWKHTVAVGAMNEGAVFTDASFYEDTIDYEETIKLNNKTMSKKKEVIEFDEKIVKLDSESYQRLKDMFNSTDKENHVVAHSILENLDMSKNLTYGLLLYKLYKDVSPDGWKNVVPKIEKVLKKLDKGKLDNVTFNNLLKVCGHCCLEDRQVIVDEYAQILKGHVTEWGFHFLKLCDWKITLRE